MQRLLVRFPTLSLSFAFILLASHKVSADSKAKKYAHNKDGAKKHFAPLSAPLLRFPRFLSDAIEPFLPSLPLSLPRFQDLISRFWAFRSSAPTFFSAIAFCSSSFSSHTFLLFFGPRRRLVQAIELRRWSNDRLDVMCVSIYSRKL